MQYINQGKSAGNSLGGQEMTSSLFIPQSRIIVIVANSSIGSVG